MCLFNKAAVINNEFTTWETIAPNAIMYAFLAIDSVEGKLNNSSKQSFMDATPSDYRYYIYKLDNESVAGIDYCPVQVSMYFRKSYICMIFSNFQNISNSDDGKFSLYPGPAGAFDDSCILWGYQVVDTLGTPVLVTNSPDRWRGFGLSFYCGEGEQRSMFSILEIFV